MSDEFRTIDDVFERLSQDARNGPVKDDLMDIKNDSQLAGARELVKQAIHDGLVTQAALARRTNIKPTAISVFLTDKWKGSPGTLYSTASALAKAVNQLLRQREADGTAVGGFVQNRFAERFFGVAQLAVKRRCMAVVTAPAGSGKTLCLEALRDEFPGSVLVTAGKTRSAVKPFLDCVAAAVGVDVGGRADTIQERIVNRLIGSDRPLLIDEAHKLQVATLDVVREIHDAAGVPVLMAATPVFRKTVTSQRVGLANRELLDQLYSRISVFLDLSDLTDEGGGSGGRLHTVEDIRRIFARGRVRLSRDAAEFLARLANTPASGGLRRCRHLMQVVIDLLSDEEVTREHLMKALSLSVGAREAGFVASLASSPTTAEPVAAAG